MDGLIELRVFLRDVTTRVDMRSYEPMEWVEQYDARLTAAVEVYLSTFGGTISLTGTPETGRVTVWRRSTDPAPILDWCWDTEPVGLASRSGASGDTDGGVA